MKEFALLLLFSVVLVLVVGLVFFCVACDWISDLHKKQRPKVRHSPANLHFMKSSLVSLCVMVAVVFSVLLGYVKSQWPAVPSGAVFTIKPIEAHAKIVVSMLQSGDTLIFAPDGVKRYWSESLTLPSLTNFTFNGGGTMWCFGGVDESSCDVVISNTSWIKINAP